MKTKIDLKVEAARIASEVISGGYREKDFKELATDVYEFLNDGMNIPDDDIAAQNNMVNVLDGFMKASTPNPSSCSYVPYGETTRDPESDVSYQA